MTSKAKGPRNCWYCGRKLRTQRGGGYTFALIKDPIDNQLRVHKDCAKHVIGNGYIEIPVAPI